MGGSPEQSSAKKRAIAHSFRPYNEDSHKHTYIHTLIFPKKSFTVTDACGNINTQLSPPLLSLSQSLSPHLRFNLRHRQSQEENHHGQHQQFFWGGIQHNPGEGDLREGD